MLVFKSIASPLSIHQLRLREKGERKTKLDFFFQITDHVQNEIQGGKYFQNARSPKRDV